MLRKAERKEQLMALYKQLRIETASKEDMIKIRKSFALYMGRDVGMYVLEPSEFSLVSTK